MKNNLLICSLFLLIGVFTSCSGTKKPDRNDLVSLMEQYLNALNYGPFYLPAAHVFKISNGKIREIEAMGYLAKHGVKNGWE
jgi:hypothetical protein